MRKVLVFPDYMSSGLWDAETGVNLDPEEIGIVDQLLQMTLRNWHDIWEFLIAEPYDNVSKMTEMYVDRWKQDGELIVNALNKYCYDKNIVFELSLD